MKKIIKSILISQLIFGLSINIIGQNIGINTPIPKNRLHITGRTQLDGRFSINQEKIGTLGGDLAFPIFEAVSNNSDSSDINLVLFENSTFSPWLNFAKARGTHVTPQAVLNEDNVLGIYGNAYDGTAFKNVGGIELRVSSNPSTDVVPTSLRFFNTNIIGESKEMITINQNSMVGIDQVNPIAKLHVKSESQKVAHFEANDPSGAILSLENKTSGGLPWFFNSAGSGVDYTGSLVIGVNNNNYMTIKSNGSIAIGNTNPTQAKLVVDGNQNSSLGNYGFLKANGTVGTENTGDQNYSIWASNRIAASQFNAFSDARIKKVKGISNNQNDLETLLKLQITDYQLVDSISRGNNFYKKVIAQQVEKVYPQAVNKLTDCIPDIYRLAKIKDNFIFLENHDLIAGEKVKLIIGEKQEVFEIESVSQLGFKIRNSKSNYQNQPVFVYGRQVADFRTVDYEALNTLNISATQALVKKLMLAEQKIEKLEVQQLIINKVLARIEKLEEYSLKLD